MKETEEEIIIVDNKELEKRLDLMKKDGAKKLHILTDFDRTITTAFVEGKPRPSLISVLRDENYITEEYSKIAKELFNKYHPIEIDPKIPMEEKKKAMKEWWETHFELLLKVGLNKKDIEKVINSEKVTMRVGAEELLTITYKNNIPVIILSSTGLGGNSIKMYLEKKGKNYKNIHIIANFFTWDNNGKAIAYSKPVIHGMNKDETVINKFSEIYKEVEKRRNVILIGDSLGDPAMIEGFEYDNLIKIGFLNDTKVTNDKIEEHLEAYKKAYDVIITNDGTFSYINKLIKEIIK